MKINKKILIVRFMIILSLCVGFLFMGISFFYPPKSPQTITGYSVATSGEVGFCLNHPPEILPIPNQKAIVYEPYTYQVQVTDDEGDNHIFLDKTTLFFIDSSTGVISFTPELSSVGTYSIKIIVLDDSVCTNDRASTTFLLEIAEASCGDAICGQYESCSSCEVDCGVCPALQPAGGGSGGGGGGSIGGGGDGAAGADTSPTQPPEEPAYPAPSAPGTPSEGLAGICDERIVKELFKDIVVLQESAGEVEKSITTLKPEDEQQQHLIELRQFIRQAEFAVAHCEFDEARNLISTAFSKLATFNLQKEISASTGLLAPTGLTASVLDVLESWKAIVGILAVLMLLVVFIARRKIMTLLRQRDRQDKRQPPKPPISPPKLPPEPPSVPPSVPSPKPPPIPPSVPPSVPSPKPPPIPPSVPPPKPPQ